MSEQMTQYQKDLVRMWDSMREKYKGSPRCSTVNCEACPLYECCYSNDGNTVFNAEKTIEVVTQWAKEHPVTTYEQKYEETFGIRPITADGHYFCPHIVGYECKYNLSIMEESVHNATCKECKEGFWQSEYKPPKKEGE